MVRSTRNPNPNYGVAKKSKPRREPVVRTHPVSALTGERGQMSIHVKWLYSDRETCKRRAAIIRRIFGICREEKYRYTAPYFGFWAPYIQGARVDEINMAETEASTRARIGAAIVSAFEQFDAVFGVTTTPEQRQFLLKHAAVLDENSGQIKFTDPDMVDLVLSGETQVIRSVNSTLQYGCYKAFWCPQ
jgi:hypothetical protein